MGKFKMWLAETSWTDAGVTMGAAASQDLDMRTLDPAKAQDFKKKFEEFMALAKRYDYIGIIRTYQITAVGYPKVTIDFLKCLYTRLSGGNCEVAKSFKNFIKIVPASLLFGTAALGAVPLLGLEAGGVVAMGIKGIQMLYWPVWGWASKNLDNPDPKVSQKANALMAAIPQQFKDMLAVKKSPMPTVDNPGTIQP